MFATGNKKMLNMLILDILEQYSDEDHHLTQQEIIRHLRAQYGMECDRPAFCEEQHRLVERAGLRYCNEQQGRVPGRA